MSHHCVRHLPVVDADGRPPGIVSRGDLLRIFLRPDPEICADIRHDVLAATLELPEDLLQVSVDGGVATLAGTLDLASAAAAVRLAAVVPGVVDVVGRPTWTTEHLSAADTRRAAG